MSQKTLFEQIIDSENVEVAYNRSRKGKTKYKDDAVLFEKDKAYNIATLINSLVDKTYTPDTYYEFYVYEPKQRLIYASTFKDKLVQNMCYNILNEMYKNVFIYDSYACIDGKGTHRAANRTQHFIRKSRWEYGDSATAIKIDVSKFFYSIDRAVLKKLIRKHIKWLDILWLLDLIIDNSPEEKGLPLGNITSHLLANLYLNQLDQYCKRQLSIKYYVRYMDDIVLIVEDKEKAKQVLNQVKNYLQEELLLHTNPRKTKIFPLVSVNNSNKTQTINYVGYKIYATHKLLRNKSKRKIKSKAKKMPNLIYFEKVTIEKAEQMLNSWYGHALYANSKNFIYSLINRNPCIIYNKNKLQINRNLFIC